MSNFLRQRQLRARLARKVVAKVVQHPPPAEVTPAVTPIECAHRWLAYCCQDCGARAPCIIGELDFEE